MVAGFLGLELLANAGGDRAAALALFDRGRALATLIDLAGLLPLAGEEPEGGS